MDEFNRNKRSERRHPQVPGKYIDEQRKKRLEEQKKPKPKEKKNEKDASA